MYYYNNRCIHVRTCNQSKETYGQTRGLSNLEMKYVGKLAIIGALLKAKQAFKLCSYHARSHLQYWTEVT